MRRLSVQHGERRSEKEGLPTCGGLCFTDCTFPAFRSRFGLSAFQRVKQLLGENCWWRGKNFLGFVSKTPPQSCQRRLWAPEGLDPGDKDARSSISRVWGTGVPTSPGQLLTVPFLFFFFFFPVLLV